MADRSRFMTCDACGYNYPVREYRIADFPVALCWPCLCEWERYKRTLDVGTKFAAVNTEKLALSCMRYPTWSFEQIVSKATELAGQEAALCAETQREFEAWCEKHTKCNEVSNE